MKDRLFKIALMLLIGFGSFIIATPNAFAEAIIADHNAVDAFDNIPDNWIDSVRNYQLFYIHQSHGSQLIQGLKILHNEDNKYYPNAMEALWWIYPTGQEIGWNGDTAFAYYVRQYLDTNSVNCDVVSVSWCGGAYTNSESEINKFMTGWLNLSHDYPDVNFIVQTSRLMDAHGESFESTGRSIMKANQYMRNFAIANNMYILDYGDIEGFNVVTGQLDSMATDSGTTWWNDYCNAGNNCPDCISAPVFPSSHWNRSIQGTTESCAHCYSPSWEGINCYRKAKAWWWLMARVAGWDGGTQTNHPPQITSAGDVDAYMDSLFYYISTAYDPEGHEVHFSYINYPHWMSVSSQNITGMARDSDVDTSFLVIASDGVLADTNEVNVTVWSLTPCGDTNRDKSVSLGDAVFLISYIFRGGPPPKPETNGDPNHDFEINVADVVYLVNYVFKGGPEPNCP